jgi:predicted DNA-binding transcriptional regulator AlpA
MLQLISKKEAARLVGFHPEHVMRLSRSGNFPKPVRVGQGANAAVRFVASEIEDWLAGKLAERDSV